jgi:hypothetical protein
MNLAQALLELPRPVAQAVYAFVLLPAQDQHPEQAALPEGWPALSTRARSLTLSPEQDTRWTAQLDWRQLPQRLCMLPQQVLERLSWYLGLTLNSAALRQVVLRTELSQLTEQGMNETDWSFIHSLPPSNTQPQPAPATDLTPTALQRRGWQALGQLAQQLPPVLAQRLGWKMPPWALQTPTRAEAPQALQQAVACAYPQVVNAWNPDWDNSLLAQATKGV